MDDICLICHEPHVPGTAPMVTFGACTCKLLMHEACKTEVHARCNARCPTCRRTQWQPAHYTAALHGEQMVFHDLWLRSQGTVIATFAHPGITACVHTVRVCTNLARIVRKMLAYVRKHVTRRSPLWHVATEAIGVWDRKRCRVVWNRLDKGLPIELDDYTLQLSVLAKCLSATSEMIVTPTLDELGHVVLSTTAVWYPIEATKMKETCARSVLTSLMVALPRELQSRRWLWSVLAEYTFANFATASR
jgi:hypothetical protein